MESDDIILWVPGVVFVLVGVVGYRWLVALQRKIEDHAERIARLEGRGNGHS